MNDSATTSQTIPPDDLSRKLVTAGSDDEESRHIGLAGDRYTFFLTGQDTAARYCLFDMHVPPDGGPPPPK